MVVRDILNIRRKQMLISYRREYHADATVLIRSAPPRVCQIEFSIEMTPVGGDIVRVKVLDDFGYPLVPLLNELKEKITEMDRMGSLPR